MKKKVLIAVFALAVCVMAGGCTNAEKKAENDGAKTKASPASDFTVEYGSTECFISEYIGSDTEIVIPEEINGKKVVWLRSTSFNQNTSIISVHIPDGVDTIDKNAFGGCTNLTSVYIPDTVFIIGVAAFAQCTSLTTINIPKDITYISDWLFFGCSSLTSIEIPDNITTIGFRAFNNCSSLTSITIPDSVTYIMNAP
ncbi:MAG: leucine-rich repeat domain-containing protein, partial [Lachnospiraceae bacterium]|nr:leucine-rich repeat domain-containing protein [Lachnospiraceae bacterium]